MMTAILSAIVAALLAGLVAAWAFGRGRVETNGKGWASVPEASPDASATPGALDPALLPQMRQRFLRAALGVDVNTAASDVPGHRATR